MDLVLVVFVVLAVAAVLGGLLAGRRRRQGPEPRFDDDGHMGELSEEPPPVPPDPGAARPAGPGAEPTMAPEPGDPAPGDPREQ